MYFTISVFDALFGVVCALMLIFGGKLVYICMLYNVYTVCKIRINNWVYFTFFLTGSIRQVIIFCSSELLVKNLHRESASLICINNFEKYTVPEIISISVLQPSLSGLEQMQLYYVPYVYCLLFTYSWPLHLLQPWQARFSCGESDYFWYSVLVSHLYILNPSY